MLKRKKATQIAVLSGLSVAAGGLMCMLLGTGPRITGTTSSPAENLGVFAAPNSAERKEIVITSNLIPTLVLGHDLTVDYTIDPNSQLDSANVQIKNRSGTLIYQATVDHADGAHTFTWSRGKWNTGAHSGAYANPKNGTYSVLVTGVHGSNAYVSNMAYVTTKMELEFDVNDNPASTATAQETAGVEGIPAILKVGFVAGGTDKLVVKNVGSSTPIVSTTQSSAFVARSAKHVKVIDSAMNSLDDGNYLIQLRDLRDDIGNFVDNDNNGSNGVQPKEFSIGLY